MNTNFPREKEEINYLRNCLQIGIDGDISLFLTSQVRG